MKIKLCPKCGSSNLGERWSNGRKLVQYCHSDEDCYWVGEPYTPSKRRITNTTDLRIDNFSGWHYIVYDRFGHIQTDSATYHTKAEAVKEMEEDLTPRAGYNDPAAPYTAVLFNVPSRVTIKGKMFKFKDGEVVVKRA